MNQSNTQKQIMTEALEHRHNLENNTLNRCQCRNCIEHRDIEEKTRQATNKITREAQHPLGMEVTA